MVQSMTGYGKSEVSYGNRKYIVEVRSLNGKNCDLSLKSQVVPRDKELEVRQYISKALVRGNIDVFINSEVTAVSESKEINTALFREYYEKVRSVAEENHIDLTAQHDLLSSLLKLPDVVSSAKEEMTEECWEAIYGGVKEAVDRLVAFRKTEGEVLKQDLTVRLNTILSTLAETEVYEKERVPAIREKILSRIEELQLSPDHDRLEQEMIFYIEKLDVNEEKVRLRQHCNYFTQTMNGEELSGKKLGFIAQEMGREINTLGSKSNQADMQKCVVRMKDELEKIKEQVLNIL